MRILEFQDSSTVKLAALGQFLLGRAKDTAAKKTVNVATFVSLARGMGIDITSDRLQSLATQAPLSNIIDKIQGDIILFKGSEQTAQPDMSVDQARDTVNKMAKRAIDIK